MLPSLYIYKLHETMYHCDYLASSLRLIGSKDVMSHKASVVRHAYIICALEHHRPHGDLVGDAMHAGVCLGDSRLLLLQICIHFLALARDRRSRTFKKLTYKSFTRSATPATRTFMAQLVPRGTLFHGIHPKSTGLHLLLCDQVW